MGTPQTNTSTGQTAAPWEPQQGALKNVWNKANQTLNTQVAGQPYQGPTYAGINDTQRAGAGALTATGPGMTNAGSAGMAYGASTYAGLPTATATNTAFANGDFTHANTAAGSQAIGNTGAAISGANQGLTQAANYSGMDPTQGNIANAAAYADNPYITGQIDAATRDVRRNLSEQVLPGLNLAAAAGNTQNSSRAGAAEAIARRGAEDRVGDIASSMRADAYARGLSMAEASRATNMQGSLGVANAGTSLAGLGVSGQNANNTATATDNSTQMGGAGSLLQGAGVGSGVASAGGALQTQGAMNQLQGGTVLQANEQGQMSADQRKWQDAQQYPWNAIGNASNVIQSKTWGGQTNGSTSQEQAGNPWTTGLSGAALIGSAFAPTGANGTGASAAAGVGGALSSAWDWGKGILGY